MSKKDVAFDKGYNEGYNYGYAVGYIDQTTLRETAAPQKWLEVSVDPKGAGHTYRLRVPGGWLFRTVTYRYPEYHAIMERYFEDYNGDWALAEQAIKNDFVWTIKDFCNACEIATQTTVFVPEAA